MTKLDEKKTDLANRKCQPCQKNGKPMKESEVREYLKQLSGWEFSEGAVHKTFKFEDYYRTASFVNAVAWIASREDHHPDIEFGYNKCRVSFRTHAVGGISENDFIAAAKIDALTEL